MRLFEVLNTAIQYKQPDPNDAAQIVELKTQLYAQNGDSMPKPPDQKTEYKYIDVLTSNNNYYKIAILNDNIIGYCSMKEYKPTKGIFGIGILNKYVGQGIGKTFMADLISHAKSHGYSIINCYVDKNNKSAIALYNKFGFTVTGSDGNDHIMERPIR